MKPALNRTIHDLRKANSFDDLNDYPGGFFRGVVRSASSSPIMGQQGTSSPTRLTPINGSPTFGEPTHMIHSESKSSSNLSS